MTTLLLWIVAVAQAQNPDFTFSYRLASGAVANVASAGNIQTAPTQIGQTSTLTFIVNNRNQESWTLRRPVVSGAGFSSALADAITIQQGAAAAIPITFQATVPGAAAGMLNLELASTNGSRTASYFFFLTGNGVQPVFQVSYIVNPGGNQTPASDNDVIRFTSAAIGQSTTVTIVVGNTGTGPGLLNRATVSGDDFRTSGLPLLPSEIAVGRDVRFTITFTPASRTLSTGVLQLDLGGTARRLQLEGQGIGAALSLESIGEGGAVAIAPDGAISFSPSTVGTATVVRLRVRNNGNSDGRLAVLAVSGTGFQLADLPALPATLGPNRTIEFTVSFTPRESGPATGRLRVEDTSYELNGTGLGPRLTFTSVYESVSTPVVANGTVLFPNTGVGSSTRVLFQITNTGNQETATQSISATGGAFTLEALPALPAQLPAGQSVQFQIVFEPDAVGAISGTLQLDDIRFTLRGTGAAPPALPQPSLRSASDVLDPLQQPGIGLSLEAPYPLPLAGRLALTFSSDSFTDDPAIQFSTGGRVVDFRIPANTTEAIFGENARQIQFQSGTVAGTITLGATFTTAGVAVTPPSAVSKSLQLPVLEPRIRNVQIGTRTNSSIELLVTGISTPRQLSQMTFQFAAAPGSSLQATTLSSNVESVFNSWFQNPNSRQFGSQFTAAVRIDVTGDVSAIQSITVSAANSKGSSAGATVNLR